MPRIVPSLDHVPRDGLRYLVATAIVVTALYVGAEILVPIALAILLSFVLAPGVRLLHRWRLGRVMPVMIMTGLAFLVILGVGALLASQLRNLADDLPRYETTVAAKVQALRGLASGDGMSRFSDFIGHLRRQLASDKDRNAPSVPPTAGDGVPSIGVAGAIEPVPVVITRENDLPLETIGRYLTPALHPILIAGLVALYVVFMLLQRDDLRNRVIRLFGAGDLHRSTAAIDEAARRLSRYLVSQIAVNAVAGLVVGLGLWMIGVPSPILFGMLFGCLRFVPYVGPPIAALAPLALAAAAAPGWSTVIWTAGLFVIVESVVGQAVEPMLYGHNTGLSPFAVVMAATFWTALWGPVGLVLSTPMTACLVVLGRHVEPLGFLEVMFGDSAPLSPPELFYQRLLADDPVEASEQAEMLLKDMPLVDYYDAVLLPGLRLAQEDVTQGRLDADRQIRIGAAALEVVDNLSDHEDDGSRRSPGLLARFRAVRGGEAGTAPEDEATPEAVPEAWARSGAVLCIGGRSALDDAAATALVQVLGRLGIGATAFGHGGLAKVRLPDLPVDDARLVCLVCLDGSSAAYLRFALRRLRRRARTVPVLVSVCWEDAGGNGAARPDPAIEGVETVATMAGAVAHALKLAEGEAPPAASSVPSQPARVEP